MLNDMASAWWVHGSLADPLGANSLVAAIGWLQDTVLGTIALSVATVAVAWIGLMMLTGRVDIRRGLTVITGCFVLFGASGLVKGIQMAVRAGGAVGVEAGDVPPPPVFPVALPIESSRPTSSDPYAGAAVPVR